VAPDRRGRRRSRGTARRSRCSSSSRCASSARGERAARALRGSRNERIELAESLYEEETGRISGCNLPHPSCSCSSAPRPGLARRVFDAAAARRRPPSLIHWFELSTRSLPILEGAAAITLGRRRPGARRIRPVRARAREALRLSREQVAFWDVHEIADRDHAGVGDHAWSAMRQRRPARRVRAAVETSLAQWWQFFDGIERAIDGSPGVA
jgi:hypothetical protein